MSLANAPSGNPSGPEVQQRGVDPSLERLRLAASIRGAPPQMINKLAAVVTGRYTDILMPRLEALRGQTDATETVVGAIEFTKPDGTTELDTGTQSVWNGHLRSLRRLIDQRDPFGITVLLQNIRQQYLRLVSISDPTINPTRAAAAQALGSLFEAVQIAFDSVQQETGTSVRQYIIHNPYINTNNRSVSAQGANVVATLSATAFAAGSLITVLGGIRTGNWRPAGIWLALFAIAAGAGRFTMDGQERLAQQVGWLVEPNGQWEWLQNMYRLGGPDWALFFQNAYQNQSTSEALRIAFYKPTKALTEQQQAELLALAPPSIHPQLRAMLASSDGTTTTHPQLRTMFSLLARATSEGARGDVLTFVQSGASRASLAGMSTGEVAALPTYNRPTSAAPGIGGLDRRNPPSPLPGPPFPRPPPRAPGAQPAA